MSERILVPKVTRADEPGPWWMRWAGRTLFRCGGICGEKMLLEDHDIRANGEVYPSVLCGFTQCGWHVWVTLEDWVTP